MSSSHSAGNREEVLNVVLANLLTSRKIDAAPESIRKINISRKMPDITVTDYYGLRIIIEGRYFENSNDEKSLIVDAKKRVSDGLGPVCIAILYPPDLRTVPYNQLSDELNKSRLRINYFTSTAEGNWTESDVNGLTGILRKSFDLLVNDDVVVKSVAILNGAIEKASDFFIRSTALPDKFRTILGVFGEKNSKNLIEDNLRVCRIACLTFANALIFQDILANKNPNVDSINKSRNNVDKINNLIKSWDYILINIDYIPIFKISKELLLEVTNTKENNEAIEILFNAVTFILNNRAALKHDLMGRVYHKLLVDAKYFGAFYTMIPSAILLTELTFDYNYWNLDFTNKMEVEKIKIGDLACGTGTLLKSSLEAVIDNYIELTILNGNQPDINGLTKSIIENNIYGYDVLPFAAHLAASTLALHEPDISFKKMNLFYLPIGGKDLRLGSLDFLSDRKIPIQTDLFGSSTFPSQVTGEGDKSLTVKIPKLDLCIMNPPFTRSVGGNLLFGSYPKQQRTKMQNKLRKIIREENINANITAGLGSAFIALADKYLNRNGHLSLILPKTVLSGDSWRVSRKILSKRYRTRYIIVSHEPDNWNFSENTKLSECMIIADGNKNKNLSLYCYIINLLHKPNSNVEAYVLASIIKELNPVGLDEEGITELKIENKKVGEVIKVPSDIVMDNLSMCASAFLQTDLIRLYYYLNQDRLFIPREGIISDLMLVKFNKLFNLGFDQRDIHDGFEKSNSKTIFPSFWGHDNEKVLAINQQPNQFLNQLSKPKPNRKLRNAHLLWSSASKLLLVERFWLTTHKLTSIMCNEKVLSTWWTVNCNKENLIYDEDTSLKILCLWMNSTIGVITMLANRTDTKGPWIKFKKPNLNNLKILDINFLTQQQVDEFLKLYKEVENKNWLTFNKADEDTTRIYLDNRIGEILNLPNIGILRSMLANEPIIALRS